MCDTPKRGRVLGEGQSTAPHQLGVWGTLYAPPLGCRLIVMLYFKCSRWLLLLHFEFIFEREQYKLYRVYTTERVCVLSLIHI